MPKLFSAFRNSAPDAIRQSASLTMAALLEQNRKFEAFMREKVAELETRVVAQQARLSEGEPFAVDSEEPSAESDQLSSFSEAPADLAAQAADADPSSFAGDWQTWFNVEEPAFEAGEPVDFAAQPEDDGEEA